MNNHFDIQIQRSRDLDGWNDERHFVDEGILWEGGWWVDYSVVVGPSGEQKICRHCYEDHGHVVCPRVVVAENEGGHNSTGICLDCVLEACQHLPAAPEPRCAAHYPHGQHLERTRCAKRKGHSKEHSNEWREW